jgi:hypothetical protein
MKEKIRSLRLSSSQVCRQLGLSEEAQALAGDCRPDEFFRRLRSEPLPADAIRLLPHLLPKRRAVWWGLLCVWHARRHDLSPEAVAALAATVQWIAEPVEAHRRACEAAAQRAGLKTSFGSLAMAAFWSEGNMSRPELPPVAPPPDLTAKVIGGVVLLAAAEHQPHRLLENYEQFLAIGEDVACGKLMWLAPKAAEPAASEGRHWRCDAESPLPPPHLWPLSVIAAPHSCPHHYSYAEQDA